MKIRWVVFFVITIITAIVTGTAQSYVSHKIDDAEYISNLEQNKPKRYYQPMIFYSRVNMNTERFRWRVKKFSPGIDLSVKINSCTCQDQSFNLIPAKRQRSFIVKGLTHVCVRGDAENERFGIAIPAEAQYLDWIHFAPELQLSGTKEHLNSQARGLNYFDPIMEATIPEKRDRLFAELSISMILRQDKVKSITQTHRDNLHWWEEHGKSIRNTIRSTMWFIFFCLVLSQNILVDRLAPLIAKQLEEHSLDHDEDLFKEIYNDWKPLWIEGIPKHQVLSSLERTLRKLARTRKTERNRQRKQGLKQSLPSEIYTRVEKRVNKAKGKQKKSRHRVSEVNSLLELSKQVRDEVGQTAADLVQEEILDLLTPEQKKQRNLEKAEEQAISKIRACSQDLVGADEIDSSVLIRLGKQIRTIKRTLKRKRAWHDFVDNFDSEEEGTFLPYLEAAEQGTLEDLQLSQLVPVIELTESQEDELPRLLSNKTVLIVGGLKRLERLYIEETQKLGAKKVTWRHHSRATLGGAQPDIVLYLYRHSSHSAYDRSRKLGVPIILVRKYQKSSYLSGLVNDLRAQI